MKTLPYILTFAGFILISLNATALNDSISAENQSEISLNDLIKIEDASIQEEELTLENWMISLHSWGNRFEKESNREEELKLESWMLDFHIVKYVSTDIDESDLQIEDKKFGF